MELPILSALLLLLGVLATSLLFFILKPNSPPSRLPPGPRPLPAVGNLLQLDRAATHASLARIALSHGPLFTLRLGSETVVVASDAASAEQVLRAHDRALCGRQIVHSVRGSGYDEHSVVWSADCGDHWRRCRGLFQSQLFGPKPLSARALTRERLVYETVVGSLDERKGHPVDIGEIAFAALLNLFGDQAFSRDWKSSRVSDTKTLLTRLVELGAPVGIEDYIPILSKFDAFGRGREAQKLRGKLFESWEGIVRPRRARKASRREDDHDFIDSLLDASLDDQQIYALLLDIFGAGIDTSTATVEWAMAELIKNPKAMEELRREVDDEMVETVIIRESHLPRLPYLQACVKEALRLHPPATIIPHRALEACTVMGYGIPEGCQVMVNVWAIGRDPRAWENPTAFSPERFMNGTGDFKGGGFEFIPFGAGRRSCPGMSLAVLVVPLILASLVLNFDWGLPDGMVIDQLSMEEKLGLTLRKDVPLILVPRARAGK